jgi:hypothetical protein
MIDTVIKYLVVALLVGPGLWIAKAFPLAWLVAKRMGHV